MQNRNGSGENGERFEQKVVGGRSFFKESSSDRFFAKPFRGSGNSEDRNKITENNNERVPKGQWPFDNKKKYETESLEQKVVGGRSFFKESSSDRFFAKPSRGSGNSEDRGKVTKINNNNESGGPKEKRPFDKKKWRQQKYSNKFKVQQWEEKRKRAVLRDYQRDLRGIPETTNFDVQKIYQEVQETDETAEEKVKKLPKKAHLEFERIKDEKQRRKEEFAKRNAERDVALKQARKTKAEKQRKLSKKTRKGQPIMKERLEMLLHRIQNSLD